MQKLLKWKLSSITPIVVRRTIQNSGFKLVRSEHSLVHDVNNPSNITNQSDQHTISLQHFCGITPPIIDAYCGTIPPPNELMMLPRSRECFLSFPSFFIKCMEIKSIYIFFVIIFRI